MTTEFLESIIREFESKRATPGSKSSLKSKQKRIKADPVYAQKIKNYNRAYKYFQSRGESHRLNGSAETLIEKWKWEIKA